MEAFYIIDRKGNEILQHPFRGTLIPGAASGFIAQFKETLGNTQPILFLNSTIIIHIVRQEVVFLVTCFEEISPLVVLEFLERVVCVLRHYFGPNVSLRPVTIQSHLDIIEQLLDEMVDDGYPVLTEADALRDRVLVPSKLNDLMNAAGLGTESMPSGNSPVPWRRSQVKHTREDICIDVVEDVKAVTDMKGKLLTATSYGSVVCNSKLSGVPDIDITLSPATAIKFPSFHSCVRLAKWRQSPGILSFIPPDGQFTLATYEADIPLHRSSLVLPVSLTANVARDTFELNVRWSEVNELSVTWEGTTAGLRVSMGKVVEDGKTTKWSIPISGSNTAQLSCTTAPATVVCAFTSNGGCASGVNVAQLKLREPHGRVFKGVRHVTNSSELVMRINT